ncbi:MAG: recombinase family protein [Ruminococcus sp.]|nr:recombinase family protein [Ruminococcus sp.]
MNNMIVIPAAQKVRKGLVRVAAYCRVSTNNEDQEHSYDAQVRYFTALYRNSQTETLVGVYADEGISGTSLDKRADFQRLLDDCRAGKIDRIVTKSVSRFARNTKDCLECLRELKLLGVTVMFEKENIDTARLSDEMMITVMGGLAQEESQSISNNVRWSIQRKMAAGTFRHARVPYGYAKDDESGNLIVAPEQAEVIRRIFGMYVNGTGARKIAVTLTEEGIPSPTGKAWNQKTILKILDNEKYTGDTLWQKTYSEFMGEKFKPNLGQAAKYYIEGSHEAIISKETFALAKEIKKKAAPKSFEKNDTPFRKKLYCGKCGHTYAFINSKRRPYWQCGCRYAIDKPCDNRVLYNDELEAAFTAMCDKLHFHGGEILGKCVEQLAELNRLEQFGTAEGVKRMKELAELKDQKHRFRSLFDKHFISEEKYQLQISEIETKIQQLSKEKLRSSEVSDGLLTDINMLAELFEDYDGTDSDGREILETAVERITLAGDTLTFRLVGGLELTEGV